MTLLRKREKERMRWETTGIKGKMEELYLLPHKTAYEIFWQSVSRGQGESVCVRVHLGAPTAETDKSFFFFLNSSYILFPHTHSGNTLHRLGKWSRTEVLWSWGANPAWRNTHTHTHTHTALHIRWPLRIHICLMSPPGGFRQLSWNPVILSV